jgi:hypothetical protein
MQTSICLGCNITKKSAKRENSSLFTNSILKNGKMRVKNQAKTLLRSLCPETSTKMLFKKFHLRQLVRPRHRVHILAIADFLRTSHHDGKISPGSCGMMAGDARPPPFSLLSSRRKLQCSLQLRGQIHTFPLSILPYMHSVVFAFPSLALKCDGQTFKCICYSSDELLTLTVRFVSQQA